MPKKPAIGLIVCPACDFNDAEVHEDKNAHSYIWCPECNVQVFTRGEKKKVDGIKRKMRAVTQPAAPPGQSPPAASPGTAGQASGDDPPKKKPGGGFKVLLDE